MYSQYIIATEKVLKKRKEIEDMEKTKNIVNEIIENASNIPVECQEHVLDVVKAMAFTRRVVEKEKFIAEPASNSKRQAV